MRPVVVELAGLLDRDPVVRMYVTEMIAQVPEPRPAGHPRDVRELLRALNGMLVTAPEYGQSLFTGTPLYSALFWTMGTPAGLCAYAHPALNAWLGRFLSVWAGFLNSPASRYVLNATERGWQCAASRAGLGMHDYQHDPEAPFWGFASWNDFFTRRLRPGARPIAGLDDARVVVAPCDSTIHRVSRGVARSAPFWIKEQPYSLADMLDGEHVDEFVGGDVLQGFLTPFDYHRWHSPVSGTIRRARVKPGLYFSKPPGDMEAYLAHVQTRAIVFIDADDPAIGLMCLMPVGMVEVSSCVLHPAVQPGARVAKGQELGHFQLGGSTYCLVFRPGTLGDISTPPDWGWSGADPSSWKVRVGQAIATAKR